MRPYRKPTQVGGKKILRRAREPTLRNSANCIRNFGISMADPFLAIKKKVAENRPKRLFTKNIGLCKVATRSIGTDTCPVLEG